MENAFDWLHALLYGIVSWYSILLELDEHSLYNLNEQFLQDKIQKLNEKSVWDGGSM